MLDGTLRRPPYKVCLPKRTKGVMSERANTDDMPSCWDILGEYFASVNTSPF